MFKFFAWVGISLFCFFIIDYYSSPFKDISSSSGQFSALVEKIRTHDTKERVTEARRVGTNPEWLKRDISILSNMLAEGTDFDNLPLTEIQKIVGVKALGYGGKDSTGSTSTIIKIIEKSANDDLKTAGLLALVRIKSIAESIQEPLEGLCLKDQGSEVCLLVKLFFERLDIKSNKTEAISEDQLKQISSDLDAIVSGFKTDNNKFSLEGVSSDVKKKFIRGSIYGKIEPTTRKNLLLFLQSVEKLEMRILVVQTISDLVDIAGEEIEVISSLMQYDPEYRVREESLLALRRIGTEESLGYVHAYGHKFQSGDVKPRERGIHPFLEWVKNRENH